MKVRWEVLDQIGPVFLQHQELGKILNIAHTWAAVLLLDEADVFLEARMA
jgi:hypothetical protein